MRLPSGNTLVATGNGHSVLEVDRSGSIVWRLDQRDLPGIVLAHVPQIDLHPRRGDARESRTGVTVHFRCRVTAPRPPLNEVNEE